MNTKDLILESTKKKNLGKVADVTGQSNITSKKKKVVQYAASAMNLLRKITNPKKFQLTR